MQERRFNCEILLNVACAATHRFTVLFLVRKSEPRTRPPPHKFHQESYSVAVFKSLDLLDRM